MNRPPRIAVAFFLAALAFLVWGGMSARTPTRVSPEADEDGPAHSAAPSPLRAVSLPGDARGEGRGHELVEVAVEHAVRGRTFDLRA